MFFNRKGIYFYIYVKKYNVKLWLEKWGKYSQLEYRKNC